MDTTLPSSRLDDTSIPGIRSALESTRVAVHDAAGAHPAGKFCRRQQAERWSSAEHCLHLVTSVNAVAKGLTFAKWLIRFRYGKARGSRTYEQIVAAYQRELDSGGKAPSRFAPKAPVPQADDTAAEAERRRILARWDRACERLNQGLESWTEAHLDRLQFPHPLLGKLTVREMLLFTHYHNLHHALRIEES